MPYTLVVIAVAMTIYNLERAVDLALGRDRPTWEACGARAQGQALMNAEALLDQVEQNEAEHKPHNTSCFMAAAVRDLAVLQGKDVFVPRSAAGDTLQFPVAKVPSG